MRVLVTSLLLATGCIAPNGDESFIIRDNLAAPQDGTCSLVADSSAAVLPRGIITADATIGYRMHPLFESRIAAVEGRESLRTIQIMGAEVTVEIGPIELFDDAGNVTIDDFFDDSIVFTSLFSSSLAPNQSLSTGQFDAVPVSALRLIQDRTAGAVQFNAQVNAVVTAFGEYYGEEIEASEYRYPITVCGGSLDGTCVRRITKACDTMNPNLTPLIATNGCNPFQDGAIECCLDPGVDPVDPNDDQAFCAF